MDSGEGSRTDHEERESPVPPEGASAGADEDARLNEALFQADSRLVASLQDEEARHRRRRWWKIGGIAMSLTVTGVIIGVVLSSVGVTSQEANKAQSLTAAGWQLWQKRQYVQAEEKFEQAVKLDPKAVNAWNGLGWARFNSGRIDEAEEPFQRCVAIEPAHPAALNGLGQLYFFRRQYDKAERYWKQCAKTAPAAWYGMAKMYLLKGEYEQAAKWANKVLAQQKNDTLMKDVLAAANAGRVSDELRKKIEPPPPVKKGTAAAHTEQGWRYFQRGMPSKAMDEFEAALRKDPDSVNAHNGMGFCLLNTGKPQEAKPHFQKCLELMPEHWGAINGLARCLKQEGKVKEAIKLWEQMVEDCPTPNAGNTGLAYTYLEQCYYEKAIEQFKVLVKADPNNADYREKLAQARTELAKER